jgi:23S rRNA pseudouridine1911/1915/1917 synthase
MSISACHAPRTECASWRGSESTEPYVFHFVVDTVHHGLRVDTFLAARLRNYTPARLQRLAAAGCVAVDGGVCPPDRRVFLGEEIAVRLAEPPSPLYPPEPIPLDVLYDDPWLFVINKPSGLIAHPAGPVEGGTLANAAQAYLDSQTRLPGLLRPGIVHRLDRETSGILLIAKEQIAHAGLTRQFERSAVSKSYLALVAGRVDRAWQRVDLPIGGQPTSLLMSAAGDAVAPRSAITEVQVIERLRSATLIEARPLTGRKHQIRVHLAAIGHPVLGDAHYGDAPARRHALHAAVIAFRHPVTNSPLRITAPPPLDFWESLLPNARLMR